MTEFTLSKNDAHNLGLGDMTGPQLRARCLSLEGLVAESALTIKELLQAFVPEGKSLYHCEWLAHKRALEILKLIDEKYYDERNGRTHVELRR